MTADAEASLLSALLTLLGSKIPAPYENVQAPEYYQREHKASKEVAGRPVQGIVHRTWLDI